MVSEWIHTVRAHGRAPVRVAWLSLGASDSDVGRFFSYLIALTHDVSNVIAVQALGSTS
jgi:ATP/maltotriose-dependent transcriptional regulator MalT